MGIEHAIRVKVGTASSGTADFSLGAAITGAFQDFADAGVPDGAIIDYAATTDSQFEVGTGIYSVSGPTLTRDTIEASSNNGAKESFSASPTVSVVWQPKRISHNGVWLDIRDYGDISGGSITTALQATINAIGSDGDAFKNIIIPHIGIDLTCGAITFINGGYTIGFACQKITFTATLELTNGTKLIGLNSWLLGTQGAIGSPGTRLAGTADPIVLISAHNTTIENIAFEPSGVGAGTCVKYIQADTAVMKRCIAGGAPGSAAPGLILDEHFWFDCQDCLFSADNGEPAVLITATTSGAVTGTGLVRFQNITIIDGSFKVHALFGASTSEGIYVDFMQHENLDAGDSIIELDSSIIPISDCIFKNILGADSAANSYTIKNTGPSTRGIRIQCEDFSMDPVSDSIEDFEIVSQTGVNSGDIQSSTGTFHNQYFGYTWPSAIDKHNVASPRGVFCPPIGTVANVNQDGTTWANESGSPVVASGQIAPDGTTNAFKITGAGGGDARRLFGPSSALGTFAVGDWLVAGCWIKSNSNTGLAGFGAYIDFNDFGGTMASLPAGQVPLGNIWGHGSVRHDGWVWFCTGVKCTTASSSLPNGPDLKLIASVGTTTKFYFNPCIQKIPASLGLSDMDVVNYIRSTSGGWSPLSSAGQIGILDHQKLRCPALLTPLSANLTVASGAITVTGSYHRVQGEGAANDDLDTINGGVDGMRLVLRALSSSVTVTVKDGTNLKLTGDMALDNEEDTIELIFDGTLAKWLEIGRSDNGA